MSSTKKKVSISAIIAALSFIYLAFCPYILNPIYNLILGQPFNMFIRYLISSIFSLGNILNFVACLVIVIGLFTKFDKIAVTVTSALLWFTSLLNLINLIINAINTNHFAHIPASTFSQISFMLVYFLMFAVALWLTVLFFTKKETPKFLKVLVFVPVAILLLICFFSFFTNISAIISAFVTGTSGKWLIYSLVINVTSIINRFILVLGFTAAAVKLADFKKKPKNTVEISENVVLENVTN